MTRVSANVPPPGDPAANSARVVKGPAGASFSTVLSTMAAAGDARSSRPEPAPDDQDDVAPRKEGHPAPARRAGASRDPGRADREAGTPDGSAIMILAQAAVGPAPDESTAAPAVEAAPAAASGEPRGDAPPPTPAAATTAQPACEAPATQTATEPAAARDLSGSPAQDAPASSAGKASRRGGDEAVAGAEASGEGSVMRAGAISLGGSSPPTACQIHPASDAPSDMAMPPSPAARVAAATRSTAAPAAARRAVRGDKPTDTPVPVPPPAAPGLAARPRMAATSTTSLEDAVGDPSPATRGDTGAARTHLGASDDASPPVRSSEKPGAVSTSRPVPAAASVGTAAARGSGHGSTPAGLVAAVASPERVTAGDSPAQELGREVAPPVLTVRAAPAPQSDGVDSGATLPATPTAQVVDLLRSIVADASADPPAAAASPAAAAEPPARARSAVVTLELNPVALGRVTVTLRMKGNAVAVRIAVASRDTLSLLAGDRHRLAEALGSGEATVDLDYAPSDPLSPEGIAPSTSGGRPAMPDAGPGQGGRSGARGSDPSSSRANHDDPSAVSAPRPEARRDDSLYL